MLQLSLLATRPWLYGDSGKLQQILFNLLGNAKDAMEGKTGTIYIETTNPNPEELFIKISDEGPGIDPGIIDKIYDPFFTTKAAGKGTGLGLGITFNLVKSMNGNITVLDTGKAGATFQLAFPTSEEICLAVIEKTSEKVNNINSLLNRTCLLVDDEADLQRLLQEELSEMGIQVDTACNGKMALALTRKNAYDFILSDLTMPEMNGLELLTAVKSQGESKGKFIIFSGNSLDDLPLADVATINKYADGFLNKPFDPSDLTRILNQD